MKNKKKIMIGILCGVLLIMGVGYSLFSQDLTVNTTGTIRGSFRVVMTEVVPTTSCPASPEEPTSKCGSYTPTTISSANGVTEVTLNTTLFKPGDEITYRIKVENQGTIAAIYKTINNYVGDEYVEIETDIDDEQNPPITTLQPTGSGYFNVTVRLKSSLTNEQFNASKGVQHSFTIIPTFEQVTSGEEPTGPTPSTKNVVWEADENGVLLSYDNTAVDANGYLVVPAVDDENRPIW